MRSQEIFARKRALGYWIERDAIDITVQRPTQVRNNSGGFLPGTPITVTAHGRLTRSPLPRHRIGREDTDVGIIERDYDRFVSLPNADLTKVLMAGDLFTVSGIDYECTKVIPYPYKRNAVIEKR